LFINNDPVIVPLKVRIYATRQRNTSLLSFKVHVGDLWNEIVDLRQEERGRNESSGECTGEMNVGHRSGMMNGWIKNDNVRIIWNASVETC